MRLMSNQKNCTRIAAAAGLAVAFAAVLVAAAPATSAPSYDGLWSVVIVTEKGTCDRAYRYPIRISNGSLVNAGDSPINISGKVGGNGSINVTVSPGSKTATSSGPFSRARGGGAP